MNWLKAHWQLNTTPNLTWLNSLAYLFIAYANIQAGGDTGAIYHAVDTGLPVWFVAANLIFAAVCMFLANGLIELSHRFWAQVISAGVLFPYAYFTYLFAEANDLPQANTFVVLVLLYSLGVIAGESWGNGQ